MIKPIKVTRGFIQEGFMKRRSRSGRQRSETIRGRAGAGSLFPQRTTSQGPKQPVSLASGLLPRIQGPEIPGHFQEVDDFPSAQRTIDLVRLPRFSNSSRRHSR